MGRMTIAREEVVLLLLVLFSVGLLAYGVVELLWPRARRAREVRRLREWRHSHPPRRRRAARREAPPIPPVAPPMIESVPPASPPMTIEELLDQIRFLIDFPLRALVLLRRADALLARMPDDVRTEALRLRLGAARAAVGCRLVEGGLAEQALAPLTEV